MASIPTRRDAFVRTPSDAPLNSTPTFVASRYGPSTLSVVDKKSGEVATTRVATWETGKNVRPMGVETAATFVQIPHHWNIQTGKWLRHYVYDRSTPAGKKPGFRQLLLTQTVSGVWHGLYAGYWCVHVHVIVSLSTSSHRIIESSNHTPPHKHARTHARRPSRRHGRPIADRVRPLPPRHTGCSSSRALCSSRAPSPCTGGRASTGSSAEPRRRG
jgi:hypothetical protein